MSNHTGFISASADGIIKFWNEAFNLIESVDNHGGIILSMVHANDRLLITGSSDHSIKVG